MSLVLANARLIQPPGKGIETGYLRIESGVIREIAAGPHPPGVDVLDCEGDFIAPGLVDIHLHGALGRDTMEASGEAFRAILRHHAGEGTTTAVLSTVASSPEGMRSVLSAASEWKGAPGCARLAGIHLEGPWFSPVRRGAHALEHVRNPSPGEVAMVIAHAGVIRRLTLAPELAGASDAVKALVAAGIPVSAGHSDATVAEALSAFRSGIRQVTHLHNAMSSFLKSDPPRRGLAEAALETPGIVCELIADGVHVMPELLRGAFAAKGWEGIVLVSDATAGCGLEEGAEFLLGGLECRISKGVPRTGEGKLAGAAATLLNGVRVMTEVGGASLAEAVAMASLVPANLIGLGSELGSMEIGKRADLIRFSPDWRVRGVWIGGSEAGDG